MRRGRRQRKTRYRKPRFDNRRKKGEGWLPPSQISRLSNVLTWVRRLSGLCPITVCSMELVKFDMQQMENPEISGGQYQQGTLAGYEVREYLLEKWRRRCAYCGAKDVPLEIEHITPRSKSRDDRVCNLTLACHPCNEKKGTQDIRDFLKHQPNLLQNSGSGKSTAQRRRRCQCHPLGVVSESASIGAAARMRFRWTHEVQPHDERLTQVTLDGRSLCWQEHAQRAQNHWGHAAADCHKGMGAAR